MPLTDQLRNEEKWEPCRGWLPLIVLAGLLLAACDSGGNALVHPNADPRAADLIRNAPEDLSDAQQGALADFFVEASEYERAVFETIACLQDAGVEVSEPEIDRDGWISFSFGGTETEAALTAQTSIYEHCHERHSKYVEQVYAYQIQPSESEQMERLRAFADCLRSKGIDVPIGASQQEIIDIFASEDDQIVSECAVAVNLG